MSKEQLLEKLYSLVQYGEDVKKTKHVTTGQFGGFAFYDDAKYTGWISRIYNVFEKYDIDTMERSVIMNTGNGRGISEKDINTVQEQLRSLISSIEEGYLDIESNSNQIQKDILLENIFNKFHKVSRQLRTRHASRQTLQITDEYDVQDLLHALLLLHFDDVRPEEWTPSYAGGAVRMDFLLKQEKIVIEVKKTRDSMTSKSLGEELIIDKEKYAEHPDCEKLHCFVYDPEGLLGNPIGIKNDLEKDEGGFIKVFIRPE